MTVKDSNNWEELYSDKYKRKYWKNSVTKETSWSDPTSTTLSPSSSSKTVKVKTDQQSGNSCDWEELYSEKYNRKYWRNVTTKETSWKDPLSTTSNTTTNTTTNTQTINSSDQWVESYSEKHNKKYWKNTITKETSWKDPFAVINTCISSIAAVIDNDNNWIERCTFQNHAWGKVLRTHWYHSITKEITFLAPPSTVTVSNHSIKSQPIVDYTIDKVDEILSFLAYLELGTQGTRMLKNVGTTGATTELDTLNNVKSHKRWFYINWNGNASDWCIIYSNAAIEYKSNMFTMNGKQHDIPRLTVSEIGHSSKIIYIKDIKKVILESSKLAFRMYLTNCKEGEDVVQCTPYTEEEASAWYDGIMMAMKICVMNNTSDQIRNNYYALLNEARENYLATAAASILTSKTNSNAIPSVMNSAIDGRASSANPAHSSAPTPPPSVPAVSGAPTSPPPPPVPAVSSVPTPPPPVSSVSGAPTSPPPPPVPAVSSVPTSPPPPPPPGSTAAAHLPVQSQPAVQPPSEPVAGLAVKSKRMSIAANNYLEAAAKAADEKKKEASKSIKEEPTLLQKLKMQKNAAATDYTSQSVTPPTRKLSLTAPVNPNETFEEKYASYIQLAKLGSSNDAIRGRMVVNGLSSEEITRFFKEYQSASSATACVTTPTMSSTPTSTDLQKKNADYFREQKEHEEKMKRQKDDEESKLDPLVLQRMKEEAAAASQHDSSKTAHYAKLGSAFVATKGSNLLGGGRGGGLAAGRGSPGAAGRGLAAGRGSPGAAGRGSPGAAGRGTRPSMIHNDTLSLYNETTGVYLDDIAEPIEPPQDITKSPPLAPPPPSSAGAKQMHNLSVLLKLKSKLTHDKSGSTTPSAAVTPTPSAASTPTSSSPKKPHQIKFARLKGSAVTKTSSGMNASSSSPAGVPSSPSLSTSIASPPKPPISKILPPSPAPTITTTTATITTGTAASASPNIAIKASVTRPNNQRRPSNTSHLSNALKVEMDHERMDLLSVSGKAPTPPPVPSTPPPPPVPSTPPPPVPSIGITKTSVAARTPISDDIKRKNEEFFKSKKTAEEAEKVMKDAEESKLDPLVLQRMKEEAAAASQHDSSKTAHYAKLGSAFVATKGSNLLGGGRGGGLAAGRGSPGAAGRGLAAGRGSPGAAGRGLAAGRGSPGAAGRGMAAGRG